MSDKAFAIAMAKMIPKGDKGEKGDPGDVSSVNGKTGSAVVLDAGDLEFDPTETYSDGSVGALLGDVKNELDELAPAIIGQYQQKSIAKTAIANFSDGADGVPLKALAVEIEPVQSGSGDPSPDNVRPITGFSTVGVTRTGKNLIDKSVFDLTQNAYIYALSGDIQTSATTPAYRASDYIYCKYVRGKTLTLNHGPRGANPGIAFYDAEKNYLSGIANNSQTEGTERQYSIPNDAVYLRLTTVDPYVNDIQLEIGTTATTYEPYNALSLSIPLGSTVYGGKLDVVAGTLTVDRAMITITSFTSKSTSTANNIYGRSIGAKPVSANNEKSNAISDKFKTIDFTTLYASDVVGCSINTVGSLYVAFGLNGINTLADANTWASQNPIQVVYPLETPTTIQLDPANLTTALGPNNIFADSGDIELTYRVEPTAFPDAPTTDGVYILKVTISGGVATYSWEAES